MPTPQLMFAISIAGLAGLVGCESEFHVHGQFVALDESAMPQSLFARGDALDGSVLIDVDAEGRFVVPMRPTESTLVRLGTLTSLPPTSETFAELMMVFELPSTPAAGEVVDLPPIALWSPAPRWLEQPGGVRMEWTPAPAEAGPIEHRVELWSGANEYRSLSVLEVEPASDSEAWIESWMWEDYWATSRVTAAWTDAPPPYKRISHEASRKLPETAVLPPSRGAGCAMRIGPAEPLEPFTRCPATNGDLDTRAGPMVELVIDLDEATEIQLVVIRGWPYWFEPEPATLSLSLDGQSWEVVDELTLHPGEDLYLKQVHVRELAQAVEARFVRFALADERARAMIAEVSVF